jgi:hypothetical protein
VHPPDRIKKRKKTKNKKTRPQKRALHWRSRPPVFIRVNRVEMLVLLLPHVGQRDFLAWDVQIRTVILRGFH